MSELKVQDFHGKQVIDSRDVAQMVERDHRELLKSIRTYAKYLTEGEIPLSDFFPGILFATKSQPFLVIR